MGRIIWRGYRWCGHTAKLDRAPGFPPRLPRHWTRYPATCIGEWTTAQLALDWLWNQLADVHDHIADAFPHRAADLHHEYDTAAQQLNGHDCACSWSIILPASIRLCVGVVAIYQHPSTGEPHDT